LAKTTNNECVDHDLEVALDALFQDNPAVAELYASRSCARGNPEGCWYAGIAWMQMSGAQSDEAIEHVARACFLSGDEEWCDALRVMRPPPPPAGDKTDFYKDERQHLSRCRAGDAHSCYWLGMKHWRQWGFAEQIFSCQRYDGEACETLVRSYFDVAHDQFVGMCRQGDLWACHNILEMWQAKLGQDEDAIAAEKKLRDFCAERKGDCRCVNVGMANGSLDVVASRRKVAKILGHGAQVDYIVPFKGKDAVQRFAAAWHVERLFGKDEHVGVFDTSKMLWQDEKGPSWYKDVIIHDVDDDGRFEVVIDVWDGGSGATYHKTIIYMPHKDASFVEEYAFSGGHGTRSIEKRSRSKSLERAEFEKVRQWVDDNFEEHGGLKIDFVCRYPDPTK
jgi:hypothetical protein